MVIFGALIQQILSSIDQVLYKKSLTFKPGNLVFRSFSILSEGLTALILAIIVGVDFLNLGFFGLILCVAILNYLAGFAQLRAFTEEKISVLMPYSKVDSVIIVLISFFLFKDTSIFSFIICLLILGIVILSNIDFKNLKFSPSVLCLIFAKVLFGINGVFIGYALTKLDMINFFIQNRLAYYILTFILIVFAYKKLKLQDFIFPKQFYIARYGSSFAWLIGFFIGMFIIKELGLVISTILGFLGMGITLIMAYFVFGDKPNKKDLTLTIIITILVFLGFYFK